MEISVASLSPSHIDELVSMWRASFERAVGVLNPYTIEEQRSYFLNIVVPNNRVLVALAEHRVVGFIAASNEHIDQLYVHPDYQDQGIGSLLLRWAQDGSVGRLSLYTFECNHRAQGFYEAKGFRVVARGLEKQWQMPDIKYVWRRSQDVCQK